MTIYYSVYIPLGLTKARPEHGVSKETPQVIWGLMVLVQLVEVCPLVDHPSHLLSRYLIPGSGLHPVQSRPPSRYIGLPLLSVSLSGTCALSE